MRSAAPRSPATLRRAAFLVAAAVSMMACTSSTSNDNMTLFSVTAGDGQSVSNGTAAQPLTVTVLDEFNNPIAGATVTWSLDSGSGTISTLSSLTGSNGQATTVFTGGATTGDAIITAAVNGFQTVKFTEHVS